VIEKKISVRITFVGKIIIGYSIYLIISLLPARSFSYPPFELKWIALIIFADYPYPDYLISLFGLAAFVGFILSFGMFVGGLAILKLKRWSRKFILAIFTVNIISKIIWISIALSDDSLKRFMLEKGRIHLYGLLFFMDILILCYFARPKVKEQFRYGEMIEKGRPVGVTLAGYFCIAISLYLMSIGIEPISTLLIYFLCAAFTLVTGVGLLRLKKYARIMAIVISFIISVSCILLAVVYLHEVQLRPECFYPSEALQLGIFDLAGLTFSIFMIICLTRPKIKEQFK